MEKTIEQIFKVFNHLAREIQIYVFSGLVIAINILILDHFYFNSSFLHFIKANNLSILGIIVLYLFGQFSMSFYYVVLEFTGIDKKLVKLFKFSYQLNTKVLPKIYEKNPDLYMHFIERYVILTLMRWAISASCFINFVIDIIFLYKKTYYWQILLTVIIFLIGALFFYLLTLKTDKDYAERVKSVAENMEITE